MAHPWSVKKPIVVISELSDAGLDALEVYRSDGKVPGIIFAPFLFLKFCHLYKLFVHFLSVVFCFFYSL